MLFQNEFSNAKAQEAAHKGSASFLRQNTGSRQTEGQNTNVIPSVEYAKRIADALGVSLDYLVSEDAKEDALDKDTVKRIRDIQKLPAEEKEKLLSVVDALVRDFKTRKAYAS